MNRMLQTSDPDIYAGGDCIEIPHLITGRPVNFPQGSLANRQGRVIGTNLAGGSAMFNGTVGSFAIKIFDLAVASAGIMPEAALENDFPAEPVLVVQATGHTSIRPGVLSIFSSRSTEGPGASWAHRPLGPAGMR